MQEVIERLIVRFETQVKTITHEMLEIKKQMLSLTQSMESLKGKGSGTC